MFLILPTVPRSLLNVKRIRCEGLLLYHLDAIAFLLDDFRNDDTHQEELQHLAADFIEKYFLYVICQTVSVGLPLIA